MAGVALLRGGGQTPTMWRVSNLSLGGASLVGDGTLPSEQLSLSLHVAGFPAVELEARVLRRQLATRAGKCGVKFVNVTAAQRSALEAIVAGDHAPTVVRRRALIVVREEADAPALARELAPLGFAVRCQSSPEQAAAVLQKETTEVLIVDESVIQDHRWNLLQFVRDTAPEIRRFVLASDVRGFRLYYAIKAGLVDGLIDPAMAGDTLARHLLGAPPAKARAPRGQTPRARRRRAAG